MFATEISSAYSTALFVFVSFFPVLNTIGGAMFFLALTKGVDTATRSRMANRIAIYSIIVLFVSMYAGNLILNFFGISIATLRVAGGIVLFGAGWSALNAPSQDDSAPQAKPKSPLALSSMAFYPFTLPLTTGPGAISVAVAIGATPVRNVGDAVGCIVGVLLSGLSIWVCYRYCDRINKRVGAAGGDALARIFAFILICLGVTIFWAGFSELWSTLPR